MGEITVKAYERKDGTAVKSHKRRWFWNRSKTTTARPPAPPAENEIIDPKKFSPLLESRDMYSIADDYMKNGQWGGLRSVHLRGHASYIYPGPPYGLFMFGGAVAGAMSIFVGFPILIGAILLAPGVLGSIYWLRYGFNYWRYDKKTQKKFDKIVSKIQKKQGDNPPTPEKLDSVTKNYDWVSTQSKHEFSHNNGHSISEVSENGWAQVEWKWRTKTCSMDPIVAKGVTYFYPEAQLEKQWFTFAMNLDTVNLEGSNLVGTFFEDVSLRGANLKNAKMDDAKIVGSLQNAIFDGATLRRTNLSSATIDGCDFRKANLEDVIFPTDLTGVKLTRSQAEEIIKEDPTSYRYDFLSFDDAAQQLGITKKQFEFMVLSGAIIPRNYRNSVVTKKFDPEYHHIPSWEVEEAKEALKE